MRGAAPKRQILVEDELFVGAYEPGETMTYWNAGGHELARVQPVERDTSPLLELAEEQIVRHPAAAWDVTDRKGTVFSLRRYEGSDHLSYDVVVDDDRVIGTFFCEGGLLHEHVIVRDDAAAPVAEIATDHRVHELRERHGDLLATCRRTADWAGNDPDDEVWGVQIAPHEGDLDRRVLVAAPLVCHLVGHRKRGLDPDSTIATALLVAVPPVGGVMIVAERVMDGLYWLRRKLD